MSGLVGIRLELELEPVAHLRGGDIVGEGSLFSEEMRTAYVVAEETTEVL